MWITQTYIGKVEPDAQYFIYYLFADYIDDQNRLSKAIQEKLEKLGEQCGDSVSILIPNQNYADRIESQVREIRPLWEKVYDKLPGLLLLPVPLMEIEKSADKCYYVRLDNLSPDSAAKTILRLKQIIDSGLYGKKSLKESPENWLDRLHESVEIKPGIFGINIDLKRLFRL